MGEAICASISKFISAFLIAFYINLLFAISFEPVFYILVSSVHELKQNL